MSGDPTTRPRRARSSQSLLLGALVAVLVAVGIWQWWHWEPLDGAPGWARSITRQHRETRPDILLVVYDARRRDDFSFGPHGNARDDTPFLAGFQRDALVFHDAVAPGTWTFPVHASMFSGLTNCDLGTDHYSPGFTVLSPDFLTLAEVLDLGGYDTIASADHPFFYFSTDYQLSLVRGFLKFDVVADFFDFEIITNVGAPPGTSVRRRPLASLTDLSREEVVRRIERFNAGDGEYDTDSWDYDETTGAYLPDLFPMFEESTYFQRRYASTVEPALPGPDRDRPFFLFVNLHMSTIALPDPALNTRWALETLMGNARRLGVSLVPGPGDADAVEMIRLNYERLGLDDGPFDGGHLYLKHVFDNRFYDATFRSLWELLEGRGLTRNLLTVVTSDHGLSLGERGETMYLHEGARPYEDIVRVPLVLRFPEGSPERALHGSRFEPVSLTDLFPTLVDVGVGRGVFERTLPIRGRSLVDRIRNDDFAPLLISESALLPDDYRHRPGLVGLAKAVYDGNLKLIHAPETYRGEWPFTWPLGEPPPDAEQVPPLERLGEPFTQLYDLAADPHERHDIAPSREDKVAELVRRLGGLWTCSPVVGSRADVEWREESMETLRALGYLQ